MYRSVFDGATERLLTNVDRNNIPVLLRARYGHFVRCRASFRSGLSQPPTFFAKAASTHQRALERAFACLFARQGVAAAATEYAGNARILYEWEGLSSSPIEERITRRHTLPNIRVRSSCRSCMCSRSNGGDARSSFSRASATRKVLLAARPSIVS